MAPANEIPAENLVNENPVTASDQGSLSQIKNRMEEEGLRAIPVVDDKNRLQGMVGYRDLIRFIQFNPEHTKIEKVMHQPPEFEMSDSLVDLAELRINSGKKTLVALNGAKLVGVIGDREFLSAAAEVDELSNASTRDIATYDIMTVDEKDLVEKARHMMLDNNISYLPVTDDSSDLTGMIDSLDILKAMVPMESQNAGGTAGGRTGEDIKTSGGGEKHKMSGVTVDQMMDRNPCSVEGGMDADKAAERMVEKESLYMIFTEGNYPERILTSKDFLEYIADLRQKNMVLVQLTGLDVPEEKAAIHRQIRKQLQGSIGRKVRRPEEVNLRIKKADKDGKKHRYEINLMMVCEYGNLRVEEEGWELLDVVDSALNELDRILRDKKEQRTDHRN